MRVVAVSTQTLSPHPFVAVISSALPRQDDFPELPETVVAALHAEALRMGFKGKTGDSLTLNVEGCWYGLIGLHPDKPADARRAGAAVVRMVRALRVDDAIVVGLRDQERAGFAADGIALAGYQFDTHKTPSDDAPTLCQAKLLIPEEFNEHVAHRIDVALAVHEARNLANEHPGRCTPTFLAEYARETAKNLNLENRTKDQETLEREGFNLLLGVGRGSVEPSYLIHLVYRGEGENNPVVCLVGKGVTYDSGGYSMKPADAQINMHLDMGGAAAVLGAAQAIGKLRPPGIDVHFIVPTVENLVSGSAFKLNEVIRGYKGPSVEILNTDAEGRLILADALSWAMEQKPDVVIDLATLTGACVVALGVESAGFFTNNEELAANFGAAAQAVDEDIWRMPLTERIADQLKSDVADIKNVGSRWGGAISAALFLQHYVDEGVAWAHLDIAGPAMMDKAWEHICRGGTGFGVLALTEYLEQLSRERSH